MEGMNVTYMDVIIRLAQILLDTPECQNIGGVGYQKYPDESRNTVTKRHRGKSFNIKKFTRLHKYR
jgi:hypothetical protein